MLLRKIKWINSPILQELELDFSHSASGKTAEIVVIAGENGNGKTTILEGIKKIFEMSTKLPNIHSVEYELTNKKIYEARPYHERDVYYLQLKEKSLGSWTILKYNDVINSSERIHHPEDIRGFKSVLSSSQTVYHPGVIKGITNAAIDSGDINVEISATKIKQLLIDISQCDAQDFTNLCKANPDCKRSYNEFYLQSRICRFQEAFNSFFDTGLQFKEIKITMGNMMWFLRKMASALPWMT
ncbi:MAG: AAA family ATPase [Odoribacter sp.]|nr:AAA family ATPase [Odoribacter sp.]